MFNDKTLLITGGTGSFGNAVLRRFLDSGLNEIRIFSRDEKKQDDMRNLYKNPQDQILYRGCAGQAAASMMPCTGSTMSSMPRPSNRCPPASSSRWRRCGPMSGLRKCPRLGHPAWVKKVIVLSTDKAVYPINAMGMSKALSEKVMVAKSRSLNGTGTVLCGTRYGNVMASRGSVIPLFIEPDQKRADHHHHRSRHDPFHDVPREMPWTW